MLCILLKGPIISDIGFFNASKIQFLSKLLWLTSYDQLFSKFTLGLILVILPKGGRCKTDRVNFHLLFVQPSNHNLWENDNKIFFLKLIIPHGRGSST